MWKYNRPSYSHQCCGHFHMEKVTMLNSVWAIHRLTRGRLAVKVVYKVVYSISLVEHEILWLKDEIHFFWYLCPEPLGFRLFISLWYLFISFKLEPENPSIVNKHIFAVCPRHTFKHEHTSSWFFPVQRSQTGRHHTTCCINEKWRSVQGPPVHASWENVSRLHFNMLSLHNVNKNTWKE